MRLPLLSAIVILAACSSAPNQAGGNGTQEVESPPDPVAMTTLSVVYPVGPEFGTRGRVTSTPAGLDCHANCTALFPVGSTVTLHVEADADSNFDGWLAPCAKPDGDCTLVMNDDVNMVLAMFRPKPCHADINCVAISSWADRSCDLGVTDSLLRAVVGAHSDSAGMSAVDFVDLPSLSWKEVRVSGSARVVSQPDGRVVVLDSQGGFDVLSTLAPEAAPKLLATLPRTEHWTAADPRGGAVLVAGHVSEDTLMVWRVTTQLQWAAAVQSKGPIAGLAVDGQGKILLLTDGSAQFGAGAIAGEWLDDDGTSLSPAFVALTGFTAGKATWLEGQPLIGGGLAVRRLDGTSSTDPRPAAQWIATAAQGEAGLFASAPDWLAARPNTRLAIQPSGKSYAVLRESADEASCQGLMDVVSGAGLGLVSLTFPLDFPVRDIGRCVSGGMTMSADGIVIQRMPDSLTPAGVCAWQFWEPSWQQ